jgi:hypothetical protein
MFSGSLLDQMQPKSKNEYKKNTKSVTEFAYAEDTNTTFRPRMEDGKILNPKLKIKEHFALDDFFEDDESGLFGILDGHGGYEVPKFCVRSIPEVFFE